MAVVWYLVIFAAIMLVGVFFGKKKDIEVKLAIHSVINSLPFPAGCFVFQCVTF
jgi:hypothetical protein